MILASTSPLATGLDLPFGAVTEPLQPAVDSVHAFLAPWGFGERDGRDLRLLVGDPLDRDAGHWAGARRGLVVDADSAAIGSKSFNRYAEWLRLWNLKAGKRWVLWQLPIGNELARHLHTEVPSRGTDNRTEYFFGASGGAHREFATDGVISLLFGAGEACQSCSRMTRMLRRAV